MGSVLASVSVLGSGEAQAALGVLIAVVLVRIAHLINEGHIYIPVRIN